MTTNEHTISIQDGGQRLDFVIRKMNPQQQHKWLFRALGLLVRDPEADGTAFPDIPVTSYAPLIIDPPPPYIELEQAETNLNMNFSSITVGSVVDPDYIERLIDERGRYEARRWVIMADSGVSF